MAEEQPGADDTNKITGKMFLYEKPELLAPEIHGNLGFTPSERPFEFVRSARAVPLTMIEFGSAQRNFPIIFSNLEDPVPLAVLGLLDDENLFVEDDGKWDPMAYVPGYLQCHPFALASDGSGRMAVVVDTS
ncbi:MAG: SapC family protein, partial [Pseudomonadota bacterium]